MFITVMLWISAGLCAFATAGSAFMIGKPRQPSTPTSFVVATMINLTMATTIIAAAVQR